MANIVLQGSRWYGWVIKGTKVIAVIKRVYPATKTRHGKQTYTKKNIKKLKSYMQRNKSKSATRSSSTKEPVSIWQIKFCQAASVGTTDKVLQDSKCRYDRYSSTRQPLSIWQKYFYQAAMVTSFIVQHLVLRVRQCRCVYSSTRQRVLVWQI